MVSHVIKMIIKIDIMFYILLPLILAGCSQAKSSDLDTKKMKKKKNQITLLKMKLFQTVAMIMIMI